VKYYITRIYVMYAMALMRWGWYKHRKADGYPITLRRAFFSRFPRFGAYNEIEVGCPDWAKKDYKIVDI
jgi:hypothetical protein